MTSRTATVRAQAKVNLFLRILARETSGYHQLETLFCRLDLGDTVRVRTTRGTWALDCSGPAVPAAGLGPVEKNLAWKAATAFADAAAWPGGVAIEIEKHIPVGGGLGGGSADAGAVLRALNALSPNPLPHRTLLRIAGTLGADVPFLTQAASPLAVGWGRGDRLLAVPPLPARGCLVVTAPYGVNTAAAYGWLAEVPLPRPGGNLTRLADLADWGTADGLSGNDFEGVVFARHPDLEAAYRALAAGGGHGVEVARMSGSGSTLFGLLPKPQAVTLAHAIVLPPGFSCLASETASTVAPVELTG